MPTGDGFGHLRQRLAGKWQIPLLALSILALIGSYLHMRSRPAPVSLEERIRAVARLLDEGTPSQAVQEAELILRQSGDFANEKHREAGLASVHLFLARGLAEQNLRQREKSGTVGEGVISEMETARQSGAVLTGQDYFLLARANEWMKDDRAALRQYEEALQAPNEPQGWEMTQPKLSIQKRVLELMDWPVDLEYGAAETRLDSFLAEVKAKDFPDRSRFLEWGLERKVDILTRDQRLGEAPAMLEEHREDFADVESANALSYLEALVYARLGEYETVENQLRELRNRLMTRDPLYEQTGWLLGRVILFDGAPQRPEEAESFFREVLELQPGGVYEAASKLGMAEALAQMEQHEEALKYYDGAVEALERAGVDKDVRGTILQSPWTSLVIDREQIRASLTAQVEVLRQRGELEQALAFARRVPPLVADEEVESKASVLWRVGDLEAAVASMLRETAQEQRRSGDETAERELLLLTQAGQHFAAAGKEFRELAHLTTLDAERSASATWRAAELYDQSGEREEAVALLRSFVREFPHTEGVPRALLRLGQVLQALGRYPEAIEAYQENQARFGRTPDAAAALIPMTHCYMALGQEHYEEAEKTLNVVLEDSSFFTPEAAVFADAVFLMGDLLDREEKEERAISILEEALERFPNDVRARRTRFVLGDVYRRSGLKLAEKQQASPSVEERQHLWEEEKRRLERARGLFAGIVADYQSRSESSLDATEARYLEHARLYEADCLFHTRRYAEALESYERAAWIYKDSPAALAAYVQIITCHVYLLQAREAEAALSRARYLVDSIPEERFTNDQTASSRDEWRQYFNWIERVELF